MSGVGHGSSQVFVGRAREVAVLDAGLESARAGRGAVVLLAGEPGIGKTRTADELARRARESGAEVLVGRCHEGEGAPPFWPWLQMLRAYAAARDATVRRGYLCAYVPDPRHTIEWEA